jgi:transposase-like protein
MAHTPKARQTERPSIEEPAVGPIDETVIAQLVGARTSMAEADALFRQMKKQILERMLRGELTHHLGYGPDEPKPPTQPNCRNGSSPKTVLTEEGAVELAIPRDRSGTFEPALIPKHQRRLPRFDENVLSLYARGISVRDIQAHLEELYQIDISPDVISAVTDEVLTAVREWQERPLDACYPVVILDALRVKIRDEGVVQNKAVYVALGIRPSGQKEILGLWLAQTEGAAFWHRVLAELQTRGVADILIALVDGLTGFADAIHAVFPGTQVHQCVVHLMRQSLTYVSWKDRKAVAAALRPIYRAPSLSAAEQALADFHAGPWAERYPNIVPIWQRAWTYVVPLFQFPLPIRRLLSTTNAVESVHMQLRKIIKTRGHFPTDEAALKLLFLAVRNLSQKWTRQASREWLAALPHLSLLFEDRFRPIED